MSIAIYNDIGVSTDSVNALRDYFNNNGRCVSGADLQKKETFKDIKLLIMPGGRSLPFYEQLGASGNNNIRHFVEQGGCYLGLCAGAYYASHKTIFAKNLPLELLLPGELNFFKESAIGPVFAEDEFSYNTEKGAQLVDIVWHDGKKESVYFNGGCYFENAQHNKNTKILAVYAENNKSAIIECVAGKGRAILSGVHPELTSEKCFDAFLSAWFSMT